MQSDDGADLDDTEPRFSWVRFYAGIVVGIAIIVTGLSFACLPVPLWHAGALGVGFAVFRAACFGFVQGFTTSFWDGVKARLTQLGRPMCSGVVYAVVDCALVAGVALAAFGAMLMLEKSWMVLGLFLGMAALLFGQFAVCYLEGFLIVICVPHRDIA